MDVWIHASGWSIDPEAPEMRCSGERSFWSGAFAERRIALPEAPCLEAPLFAPADLVFERSEHLSEDAARKLMREGLSK